MSEEAATPQFSRPCKATGMEEEEEEEEFFNHCL
jgi:hypothetical protein